MNGTIDSSVDMIAFTWIPDPDRYNSFDPARQYQALLVHILLTADRVFDLFYFFPELTKQGNIHIHGFYSIKDYVKYYKLFLPKCKTLGFVKIKYKNITTAWGDYCAKEKELMKSILGDSFPVPLSHKNIKEYKHLKRKRPLVKEVLRETRYNIAKYFK